MSSVDHGSCQTDIRMRDALENPISAPAGAAGNLLDEGSHDHRQTLVTVQRRVACSRLRLSGILRTLGVH